jgi:3-hydroxypropanoate dehydrogenase
MTNPALATLDASARALLFTEASTPGGFTSQPVSDAEVIAAYDLAKWAPTAFNSQPLRLVLVNSPASRAKIASMVMEGNQERIRTAPQVVIVAADNSFEKNFEKINPGMANAPLWQNLEFKHNLAVSQTWLQLGYFTLALRAQGLAVGPMTGIHNAQINEGFFAGSPLEVMAVLAIGHPDLNVKRSRNPRLSDAEVIQSV